MLHRIIWSWYTGRLWNRLLHLIQWGKDWAGPQLDQAPPRCTKCNSPLINGQCTNHRITVWTVVQTVLTATFNSYRDRQISTPHKINTLNRSTKKIGTIDYIREGTSYIKFGRNPFTGGFWANGWNITKIICIYLFIYTLFFFDQPTGQTRGWIFTRDSSKDVKSHKDVPFWGYKT